MKGMRVWVCETLNQGNARWYVWKSYEDRYGAYKGAEFARKAYPKEKFRVRKYVPDGEVK